MNASSINNEGPLTSDSDIVGTPPAPDSPLVTIITPVFNQHTYLLETLRSICRQSYPNIQHIVVNDGSTDGTAEELARFEKTIRVTSHYRIEIIDQENSGEASAVNAGFRSAEGVYIAVVNADDPQPVDWLAVCVDAMESNPGAVVGYPDWAIINCFGKVIHRIDLPPYSRYELIAGARCLPGPGTLIRRRMVERAALRQDHLLYTSDYACWLDLSLLGPFIHIPGTRAHWRDNMRGKSTESTAVPRAREYVGVVCEFFQRPDLPKDVRVMKRSALAQAAYQATRMTWRSNFWIAGVFFCEFLLNRVRSTSRMMTFD